MNHKNKLYKHNIIVKMLKLTAWAIGIILGLVLLLLVAASIILTPERLTPLVEKYADEYINADLKAKRVELTIWKTFPHCRLDIDSLRLESNALKQLSKTQRDSLPKDADQLLKFNNFTGGINLLKIIFGNISLSDVCIDGLSANIIIVNDSIANYDITYPTDKSEIEDESSVIPSISFDSINLKNTGNILYTDLASGINATLKTATSKIENIGNSNEYAMQFDGHITASTDSLTILNKFPYELSGKFKLDFDPFRAELIDYKINLGELKSTLSMSGTFEGNMKVENFDYKLSPTRLLRLAEYIPTELLPDLSGLNSNIAIEATISLKETYHLSNNILPSFQLNIRIPDSSIDYTLKGIGSYHVEQIGLDAAMNFDGRNIADSHLIIPKFILVGEGMDFDIEGDISDLLGDPKMDFTILGNADFGKVMKFVPGLEGIKISGELTSDTHIMFNLSDITESRYANVGVTGNVGMNNFTFDDQKSDMKVYSRTAQIKFGSNENTIRGRKLEEDMLMLTADFDTVFMSIPGIELGLRGGKLSGGSTRDILTASSDTSKILPIGASFSAERVKFLSIADSSRISARNILAAGSIKRFEGNEKAPLLTMVFESDRFRYADRTTHASLRKFTSEITAHLNKRKSERKSRYQIRYDSIANANPGLSPDSIASLARHKRNQRQLRDDEVVTVEVDNSLKDLIRQWQIHGSIKSKGGTFSNCVYPVRNRIQNLNLEFSLDSIVLHNVKLHSQNNSLTVKGSITNLRQIMLGRTRRPVKIRLNAKADTINVNQMAATYEKGIKLQKHLAELGYIDMDDEESLEKLAEQAETQEPDSTISTIIVPRNIDAEIYMNADLAIYTNILLNNLGAGLLVKDGALSVDSLRAETDFGNAYLNLLYSSRDLDNLHMGIDLGFDRVNISNFFNTFTQLQEMMPVMNNLNGFVSAKFAGSFNLFPNMDINFPTLNAVFDIRGNNLIVHQNDVIRKITRMMLIHNSGDLKINDMVIQAVIKDNMMQLYPFIFEADRYKLALMGENDFTQNMYYHLSILKSPIPFKFGINVKGTFDKPKIRFGGAKYKEGEAQTVKNLVENQRVNLVSEMKKYLNKFVRTASLANLKGPNINLLKRKKNDNSEDEEETLSAEDSLQFIDAGLIEAPVIINTPQVNTEAK